MLTKEGAGELDTKEMAFTTVTIGDNDYSLFEDTNEEGVTFYYLKLQYGPEGSLTGGFLADSEGNLIDEEGEVLKTLEEMEEWLDNEMFDEWAEDTEPMQAVLIKEIIEYEEETDEDLAVGEGEDESSEEDLADGEDEESS